MPRGRKCRESYYFPDRAGEPGETRKKKGAKK